MSVENNALFGDTSLTAIDGHSRLTIHGSSRVDITGSDNGEHATSYYNKSNTSPEIYIHDHVMINIDSSKGTRTSEPENMTEIKIHGGVLIDLCQGDEIGKWDYHRNCGIGIYGHGGPIIKMGGKAAVVLNDGSLIHTEGKSEMFMAANSRFAMAGIGGWNNDNSGGGNFEILGRSYFKMQHYYDGYTSPTFEMNGGGSLIFNGRNGENNKKPMLLCEPQALFFSGQICDGIPQDSSGNREADHSGFNRMVNQLSYGFVPAYDKYGNKISGWYLPSYYMNPLLYIAGHSKFHVEGQSGSSVDFRIGPNAGEVFKAILSGNTFIQTTGTPHMEFHNGSTVIMRGPLEPDKAAWEDSAYFRKWNKSSKRLMGDDIDTGYGPYGNRNPSMRPVLPTISEEKGAHIAFYDEPIVVIRGTWNDTKIADNVTYETSRLTTKWREIGTANVKLNSLSESRQNEIKQLITSYYGSRYGEDRCKFDFDNCLIRQSAQYPYYGTPTEWRYTVVGINYKVAPPNGWSPHVDKHINNPYIEITDNSEVKLSQNFSITGNNNGITFSNGTKSIDFSFAELEKMKRLLSSN